MPLSFAGTVRHGILDCRQQFQHFRGLAVRLSPSREHWIVLFGEGMVSNPFRIKPI
jgi:hypothetical protein